MINLNNGKSDEETNGSWKGDKKFASTDQGVRVTGPSGDSGHFFEASKGSPSGVCVSEGRMRR